MKNWKTGMLRLWEKYKYFIAVILVGAVLLCFSLPSKTVGKTETENEDQTQETFDLTAFQQEVAESLSEIDGAGRVKVLLSLETGAESVYASDISKSSQNSGGDNFSDSESYQSTMSILSDGSYGETPVLIKNKYPTFRGAVVLCDGADSDTVRLAVTQAVGVLCGISSDHISISKMSQ